jgi:hypothetical protein
VYLFLDGATAMASFIAALLLLKSWNRTQERLFVFFSAAFTVMAIERCILGVVNMPEENTPLIYLLRLLAFALIVIGIVDKNRR